METPDLSELQDSGDVLKLEDGRTLRLRIEVDQDASINDYESDGRIEWGSRQDRDYIHGYGRRRPEGFTGRARIIRHESTADLWWEPYEELTEAQIIEEMPRIKELELDGFKGVILELLDGTDAYGRPVVVQVASLWGIDSLEHGYLTDVVTELYDELDLPALPEDNGVRARLADFMPEDES